MAYWDTGEDDDFFMGALEDVGAPPRRGLMRRGRGRGALRPGVRPVAAPRARPPLMPAIPGVNTPAIWEVPIGAASQGFTSSSGTSLTFTINTQKPFQGHRLILDVTRTGTSSTGLLQVTSFLVGANNVLPSSGPIGGGAFSNVATGVMVQMPPAVPGISITLIVTISAAPTTTDRVDVAPVIFGRTIG